MFEGGADVSLHFYCFRGGDFVDVKGYLLLNKTNLPLAVETTDRKSVV